MFLGIFAYDRIQFAGASTVENALAGGFAVAAFAH